MNIVEYMENAERTVSDQFHTEIVSVEDTLKRLPDLEYAARALDNFKKGLFYGKPFKVVEEAEEITTEVEGYVVQELHNLLGLYTEVAELSEAMRALWRGEIVKSKAFDELGDILWYWINLVRELGGDAEKIMDANIAKLKARFPEKFTETAAINRNESDEESALNSKL